MIVASRFQTAACSTSDAPHVASAEDRVRSSLRQAAVVRRLSAVGMVSSLRQPYAAALLAAAFSLWSQPYEA